MIISPRGSARSSRTFSSGLALHAEVDAVASFRNTIPKSLAQSVFLQLPGPMGTSEDRRRLSGACVSGTFRGVVWRSEKRALVSMRSDVLVQVAHLCGREIAVWACVRTQLLVHSPDMSPQVPIRRGYEITFGDQTAVIVCLQMLHVDVPEQPLFLRKALITVIVRAQEGARSRSQIRVVLAGVRHQVFLVPEGLITNPALVVPPYVPNQIRLAFGSVFAVGTRVRSQALVDRSIVSIQMTQKAC